MSENFWWTCDRCGKSIMCLTERGLADFVQDHRYLHTVDDKINNKAAEEANSYETPEKNYNILQLTREDIGFLKTRGVSIDSQIELDLLSEHKPSKTRILNIVWKRVLDNAWEPTPPKETQ